MKHLHATCALLFSGLLLLPAIVGAVDHNNIDAGRPLSFEDADAIALHERAVEVGASFIDPNRRDPGAGLDLEFIYGFALNSHVSLDIDPSWGGRSEEEETRFDAGDLGIGLFHNFNREYGNAPAFSMRGDVFLPTGRDSEGVDSRLRAILSRHVWQYNVIHLNVDGTFISDPDDGERDFQPAAILGYSRAMGYPRRFQTTAVAELGIRSGAAEGSDPVGLAGLGLRRQMTVRSVMDVGIETEIASDDEPHDEIRVTAGYSFGF